MKRVFLSVALGLAATAGWFGGSLSNEPGTTAAQSIDTTFYVNPGGSGNGVNLTCLWHTTCGSTSGVALDWGNYAYQDVYWRSWGYYLSSYSVAVAKVTVGNRNSDYNCKTSVADINQYPSGVSVGRMEYTHVDFLATEGDYFYAYARTSHAYSSWGPIAEAVDYGQEQCTAFDDPHLHQRAGAGSWTHNTSRWTPVGGPHDISYLPQWQSATSW